MRLILAIVCSALVCTSHAYSEEAALPPIFVKKQTYDLTTTKYEKKLDLPGWDYCALSKVLIAGEDKNATDNGQCLIMETVNGWLFAATLSGKTNEVECSAICMSIAWGMD